MIRRIMNIAPWCASRSPWQQRGFVFLLGSLSVLALAPFYIIPVLFITLPLFLLCHDGVQISKSGFWLGWWFAFGYFTFGLYWIAYALFVDIARFWWVLPFAVMGLPFGLSFFWAAASALLVKCQTVTAEVKWLSFVVLFSSAEWLRGHILTGFPWNLVGYIWVDYPPILQGASLAGIYGLTWYTFLIAGVFYLLWHQKNNYKIVLVVFTSFILLSVWGMFRVASINLLQSNEVLVRLVQPNIAQKDKWVSEKMPNHFEKLVALSSQPSKKPLNAIIWPETATAFFDTFALRRFEAELANFIPNNGYLLTGVLDYGYDDAGTLEAYNRLSIYDQTSNRITFYDKHHLVPFGEYLPFEEYWPVNPVASNGLMFNPGSGVRTISLGNLPPFSPLICYEAIFPAAVAKNNPDRPRWLLNLTNDAWYGYTTGPFQHLSITQTRAVEEGVPMVRVANTGISAVVNAAGQITHFLPLEEAGIIDAELPGHVASYYARFGDLGFFILIIISSLMAFGLSKYDR